jgi:hypothetical protein
VSSPERADLPESAGAAEPAKAAATGPTPGDGAAEPAQPAAPPAPQDPKVEAQKAAAHAARVVAKAAAKAAGKISGPAAPRPAAATPAAAQPKVAVQPVAATPTVLPAPRTGPSAAEVARLVRRERARRLFRALLIWVALPTVLGIVYYGFVAATQYESVATLVINGEQPRPEMAATLLREHVLSRDMLRTLEEQERFAEHYQKGGDFLSRLARDARSETRYAHFLKNVDARYEPQSHVFSVRVRAYSGQAAQRFVQGILREGEAFVLRSTGTDAEPFYVVAAPSLADEATYPRRVYSILTVFFAALALFAIGSLLVAAVREHAQF